MKQLIQIILKVLQGLTGAGGPSKNEEQSEQLFRLVDACCEAYDNPAFQPKDGVTYCNQAVQYVAEKMNYTRFNSKLANQIVQLMEEAEEWREIPIKEAQINANQGRFVVAGLEENPHGHVVVVRPGLMGTSGKWGIQVPKVLNVGKENFIAKGLNWAFREKPKVFVLERKETKTRSS
jgi:predicted transcriptional regulator